MKKYFTGYNDFIEPDNGDENVELTKNIDTKSVKKVMPIKKFKHSKRVAELTKLLKNNVDVYSAAVYHDFLERGGSKKDMKKILSPYAFELVKVLTNENKEDTLNKFKKMFGYTGGEFLNDIIIIKLCDRTDNLKKRSIKNTLDKEYIKSSVELIQWMWDKYKGDKSKIKNFIEFNIFPYVPKIRKKLNLS